MLNIREMFWTLISSLKKAKFTKYDDMKLLTVIDKNYKQPSRSLVILPPPTPAPSIKEHIMKKIETVLNLFKSAWEKPKSIASSWVNQFNGNMIKIREYIFDNFSLAKFDLKTSGLFLGVLTLSATGYLFYTKSHQNSLQNKDYVYVNIPNKMHAQTELGKTPEANSRRIVLSGAGDIIRMTNASNPINYITVDRNGMVTKNF